MLDAKCVSGHTDESGPKFSVRIGHVPLTAKGQRGMTASRKVSQPVLADAKVISLAFRLLEGVVDGKRQIPGVNDLG